RQKRWGSLLEISLANMMSSLHKLHQVGEINFYEYGIILSTERFNP
ncbi:643_t:CDS:1, partial [Dentiscutata heterogama]